MQVIVLKSFVEMGLGCVSEGLELTVADAHGRELSRSGLVQIVSAPVSETAEGVRPAQAERAIKPKPKRPMWRRR